MEQKKEVNYNENKINRTPKGKSTKKTNTFITIDYKVFGNNYFINNINKQIIDRTCPFCKQIFYSKFNRIRHQDNEHKDQKIEEYSANNENVPITEEHIKNTKIQQDSNLNINNNSKLQNENIEINNIRSNTLENKNGQFNLEEYIYKEISPEKTSEISDTKFPYKAKRVYDDKSIIKIRSESYFIDRRKSMEESDISSIIKNNLYNILSENEYISLNSYFLFKKFMIGLGKYGTVWIGLNLKEANFIAIKSQNNDTSEKYFELEALIMQNLKKYKIFSKLYDKLIINNRIYLVQSLNCPNLDKFKKFCGNKFSIITIYKIGIEILRCFKYIHESGYIYLDLKADNISILFNPIKKGKHIQNITIIDFGFCAKFNKDETKWPKGYGNMYFSSINALKRMPISFKDDIISLCYLLIDLYSGLPWDNIFNDNNYKKKCIKMKENFDADLFCGKEIKEISIILNKVNKLKITDLPNYSNYIKILKDYIKKETMTNMDDILFDWDLKIIKLIQENSGIENLIKNDKEIAILFEGYPKIFYKIYLKKYLKYI